MPQDTPATDAGTDSTTELDTLLAGSRREVRALLRRAVTVDGIVSIDTEAFTALLAFVEDEPKSTPGTWAPVNRRTMRDEVDRFRNLRMIPPATLRDALHLAAVALEYYEHAAEVATRSAATLAGIDDETDQLREFWTRVLLGEAMGLSLEEREAGAGGVAAVKSRNAAKDVIDTIPALVTHLAERRTIANKKAEADKEMGVARRRHATAITFAHAFTFATPDALKDPSTVAAANSVAAPDVTAGDTDAGSHAEVK